MVTKKDNLDIDYKRLKAMKKSAYKRDNLTGYAFLLPNITGFLLFTLLPVLAFFYPCFL